VPEAWDKRVKTGLEFSLARRGNAADRPSVKRVLGSDDLESGRVYKLFRVFPCQLDGCFNRLRTRIAEEDFIGKTVLNKEPRKLDLGFYMVIVGDVNKPLRLLLEGDDDAGMAMTEYIYGHSPHEIEILLPVIAPDLHATPLSEYDRKAAVGIHEAGGRILKQFFRLHAVDNNGKTGVKSNLRGFTLFAKIF
jgi:hypothetical protein